MPHWRTVTRTTSTSIRTSRICRTRGWSTCCRPGSCLAFRCPCTEARWKPIKPFPARRTTAEVSRWVEVLWLSLAAPPKITELQWYRLGVFFLDYFLGVACLIPGLAGNVIDWNLTIQIRDKTRLLQIGWLTWLNTDKRYLLQSNRFHNVSVDILCLLFRK